MSRGKLIVGIYSFSSCEGCRHEVLNLGEELLKILSEYGVEIAYEPLLGYTQERSSYDVVLIEGAVSSKEDIGKLLELRKRARILIAMGSCSYLGGIASLSRWFNVEELLKVYDDSVRKELISKFTYAKPITSYVKVDYWLRGCPINAREFIDLLRRIAVGEWFRQGMRRFEYCRPSVVDVEGRILRIDGAKCIVCGRCVGICRELGVSAIGIVNRGIEIAVSTPFAEPFEKTRCILCGLCTAVCPVDAITFRQDLRIVQRYLAEGKKLDLYIEPESLAALMARLGIEHPGKIVTACKLLGFSRVFIWSPLSRVRVGPGLTIVPVSEAEYRFVEQFYPELKRYLIAPPKLPYGGVVVTACIARKVEGEPVLTTREFEKLLVGQDVDVLSPSDPDGLIMPKLSGVVKSVGPYEVRGVLEAIRRGYIREGTVVLYICPQGCLMGGGQPYIGQEPGEEVSKRLRYMELVKKYGFS